MSTTYHDPITVGAAANAATVNLPLGELDAAIAAEAAARAAGISTAVATEAATRAQGDNTLDARIDAIVATTGDDIVEVVDARGAGNVSAAAATLADRIEWLEGANTFHARAYGFHDGGTAAANKTAFDLATAAATAASGPAVVVLPAGRFAISNATIPAEVFVIGAHMPSYNSSSTNLEGGTVLTGGALTLSDRSGVMNLGIQVAGGNNAISGGASSDCSVINVATKGSGAGHGCVFLSGARNLVHNFRSWFFDHGLVFKGSYNIANTLFMYDMASSSVTLASDAAGPVLYNVISNLISTAASDYNAGAFRIHAITYDIMYNQISNVFIEHAARGFLLQYREGVTQIRYNVIGPGIVKNIQFSGVDIFESTTPTPVVGDGADFNIFTGLLVDDANVSFTNASAQNAILNNLVGCQSIAPRASHSVGVFGQYGINQQSGLIAKLAKSAGQSIANGPTTWVDVTWTSEAGPFSIWNPAGDDTTEFGNVPFSATYYRIIAYIQFAPNGNGNRYVQLVRAIGAGTYSALPFGVTVRPALVGTSSQGIILEFSGVVNASYRYKIQVKQDSTAALDVESASYVTVSIMK